MNEDFVFQHKDDSSSSVCLIQFLCVLCQCLVSISHSHSKHPNRSTIHASNNDKFKENQNSILTCNAILIDETSFEWSATSRSEKNELYFLSNSLVANKPSNLPMSIRRRNRKFSRNSTNSIYKREDHWSMTKSFPYVVVLNGSNSLIVILNCKPLILVDC